MKKTLTLPERFALITLLPAKGNCITLERARELHKRLVPTPAETKDLKITDVVNADGTPTGGLQWPAESSTIEAEIEIDQIGETMDKSIKATLTKLDKTGELTHATSPLYRIFVKAAEEPAEDGDEDKT